MFGLIIIMTITILSAFLIGWGLPTALHMSYKEPPKPKDTDRILYGRDGLNFVVKGEK